MFEFPDIDPVIFSIGPLAIRWYSLSYIMGIVLGCLYADRLNRQPPVQEKLKFFDDFMVWAILGIIIGGRIGYVLFYNFSYYIDYPIDALKVWQGGMSFHGGLVGTIIATVIFSKKYKIQLWPLFDLMACAAPIGLFFGRIANFINGELYGRVTTAPVGIVFPNGGPLPRHPSQLYEATLEGLLLFIILFLLVGFTKLKQKPGILSGVFLMGYGVSRIIVEYFREPDAHIGFVFDEVTRGQLLSVPMVLLGVVLVVRGLRIVRLVG